MATWNHRLFGIRTMVILSEAMPFTSLLNKEVEGSPPKHTKTEGYREGGDLWCMSAQPWASGVYATWTWRPNHRSKPSNSPIRALTESSPLQAMMDIRSDRRSRALHWFRWVQNGSRWFRSCFRISTPGAGGHTSRASCLEYFTMTRFTACRRPRAPRGLPVERD